MLRHVHRLPSREITKEELKLAHTAEHIRNYYAPPSWYQRASRAVIKLPTPPPSSTGSATNTTSADSAHTTPPPSGPALIDSYEPIRTDNEKQVTFADSPVKMEFEPDFPALQASEEKTLSEKSSTSPHKRRASGLDMDLMNALAAKDDEIEVKPAVWPVTLTFMMGCGELAIGITLPTLTSDISCRYNI